MVKKYGLNQFSEKKLDNWGANIRFGYLDSGRVFSLQFALLLLEAILLFSVILFPKKYNFEITYKEYFFASYIIVFLCFQ